MANGQDDEQHPTGIIPPAASEIETIPEYSVEAVDINYRAMLEKFRERCLFVDGVRKEAIARTKPHHWLARKDAQKNTTFSLMGPGAERIKTLCPIGMKNIKHWEEPWNKQDGPGYTIYYSADVYLGSEKTGTMPVLGCCASNSQFFATEHDTLPYNEENPEHKTAMESGEGKLSFDKKTLYIRRQIPASEVTKENIMKAALTQLIVNGVTRVLGIRALSTEELKEAGIDTDKIPSIDYGSKKQESGRVTPAAEEKRTAIWKMLVEISAGNEEAAAKSLQGWTAFKDFPGVTDVKRLSEAQINIAHGKIKQQYDAWTGEKQAKEAGQKPGK